MKNKNFSPLLAVAAAFFVFAAPDARAQVTVGSDGPDETDANDYTGAQTLTKIGSNTVSLTGTSTYSDTTTISAGTLSLGNGGTTGSISGTANVVVNSLLQFNRSDAIEFDKVISGTGGILKSGANTVTLSADNSFSGSSRIDAGTLQVGNGGTTGSIGTSSITNNGALIFNRAGVLTNSGEITGTGSLTMTGTGKVVLTGTRSYTGPTAVNSGTLEVIGGYTVTATAYTVTNDATLQIAYNNVNVNFNGAENIKVYGDGTNATTGLYFRGGTLWNATSEIQLLGAPTTIRSYETDRGLVGIGTWAYEGLTVSSNASGSVTDSGIEYISRGYGVVVRTTAGANNATGDLVIEGRLNVGPTSLAAGQFTKRGNGSVRIMSAGTTTNNSVVIEQGLIIAGTAGVLGDHAQLDVASAGTFKLNGFDQTARMLGGSGRIINDSATEATLTVNQTNKFSDENPNTTFSGVIGGTNANEQNLSLVKNGFGTLALSGNNNYSGTTFIAGGPLQIGAGGASGSLGTGAVTNNGSLIINRNNDYALSNNISGTGSFEQAGTGRTILSGTNTYDGTTTVGAGTLQFSKVSSFYNGNTADWTEANIIVRSNATLGLSVGGAGEFTQGNINTILANLDGSVTTGGLLAGSTIAFATDNTPGGNFVLTNAILDTTGTGGGSVGLGKLGAGTMILTSDQGYSGTTTIHAGTLSLGNGGTTGSISNTANVVANGTLQFNRSDAMEFDRTISGTGGILKSGANTVTLSADNSFSGASLIETGTLQIGNGGTTGSLGTGSITNNGTLIFNRDGLLTNSGTIRGTGSLTKTGAGTVVFTGVSANRGLTTVAQGALEVLSGRTVGADVGGSYLVTNNAKLMMGFDNGFDRMGIKVYGDGTNATTGLSFRGGTLWRAEGPIELLGAPTTIRSYDTNGGLVGLGNFNLFGDIGVNVSSDASGSVIDAGIQMVNLGYGSTVTVAVGSNNATGDLIIEGRLNVAPRPDGGAGFYKAGNGSVRIMSPGTTTNNWVGIGAGVVIAGTNGVLGDNAQLDVSAPGTLRMNGFDQTARMLTGAGRIVNGSATAAVFTINQTNRHPSQNPNTTFSGVIGGTNANEQNLSLVKNGFGTLTLSGNNNYSGTTFIAGGPLQIGAGGASGSLGTGAVTNNGSLIINRNNDYALSNNISGTGSFQQAGTGRTILSGTNTYDGTTTVGAGTLQFATLASLYNGATAEWTKDNITVRSNAAVIFNVGGAGEFTQLQINTLMASLGGTVNSNGLMGGSSLGFDTANAAGGNFAITNTIADTTGAGGGSIGLVKYGANTLTLAADSGYTGGTTIYAGTLAVGTGGTTGSISGNVDNRGNLLFNRSDNTTFTGVVSGAGSLVNAGAGTTTLTGSNTYTGTTSISAGGLVIGGSGVLGGGNYSANITNIGSFTYNSSANQTLRGTFSGGGAINKDGTGSLTLAGVPNYGGSTVNISNGTVLVTGSRFGADIGLAAINVVGSNAVLQTTTHALGGYGKPVPAIAITNGTWNLLNEQYVNSLTLNQAIVTGPGEIRSDNSFSVLVTNGTSTWSAPLNLVNRDGFFNVASDATLQMSDRIFGNPGLVKNGEGTMVLNATNTTYSGATTISNGVLRAGANDVMSPNSIIRVQGGAFDPNGTTNTLRSLVLYNVTNGLKAGEKITTTVNSDESFQLGSAAGNVTEYNMTGGEFVVASGHLQNGYYGKSTLNQSGGTLSVSQGFFVLGRMAGGEGIYNLTGGSAVQSNTGTTMNIGELGRGVMNVSGTGTLTAAGTVRIGMDSASSGALNILDGGTVNAPRIEFGAGTNNSVNFDRSDSLSFTSPITGAGYVTKTGMGTVTFTQNNGYTLGTTVNGGTLAVLGLANNESNTITVNSGGTFVFNTNNTFGGHAATILTPIVINDGGVVRSGSSNIFNALGSVKLNGGTLESVGGITHWSWNDTPRGLALKGDVTVGGSNTSTIAGPGILLGSAAVTGTTFNVSNGAAPVDLRVTAGLADGPTPGWWYAPQPSYLTKVGSGNMQLEGTNTYTGNTTVGAGTLTLGAAGQLGSGNYNGDMVISNGATFVQASSANQTLGGVISGGGNLIKSSTGTLTMDGLENTYTGTTSIDGGTLLLNVNHTGVVGDYTVNNGGTLSGIGKTTADVTVNSGGTIAPGNSPGELTVGNFTLNNGGTLNIFLSGGVSSLLQVNGNVNLLGGGVDFTTLTTPLTASLYTFVQYTGSLTGTFGFTNNLPTGYELVYGDDQTIFLSQSGVAYPVAAVFNGTNAVITGGTLPFEVAVYNNDVTNVVFNATNGSNTTGGFGDTPLAVDDSTNVAGLTWNGTNVGANQAGNFAVTFSNGIAANQTTNVAVTVSVYDHAAGSLVTNAITNLDAIVGYTGSLSASILATNAAGFRAPLGTTSTSTNGNLAVTDVNDVDPENSDNLLFALTGQGAGAYSNDVTVIFRDSSTLSGASTNLSSTNVTVTGTIYSNALGSVLSTNLNFARVHVGYTNVLTTTNSITLSNAAGLRVDLGVANNNTDPLIDLPTVAGLTNGTSTNLFATLDQGKGVGQILITNTLTFFDDSTLLGAKTNLGTTNIVIEGYVYSGQGVWTAASGGNWTNFANWTDEGGVPGIDGPLSVNDTAFFGTNGSGPVTLDTTVALLSVTFSNTNSYNMSGSGTLTLAASGPTDPSITSQAGTHTISNTIAATGNLLLDTTNNAGLVLNGVISGAASLVKDGAGTTTLSAANTYTGGTTISGGAISVSADANLGAAPGTPTAGNVTLNGGKLFVSSSFVLGSTRGLALGASGGTIEVAGGQSVSYGGIAAGSGALTKSGAGSLTLSGANTYSGATTVSAGTLELANASGSALGSTASLNVASGATLLISQSNQVNNNAAVTLSGGTITRGSGVTEVFGNLNLTEASFLDFGTGTAGNLTFGTYQDNTTPSALLTLNNFIPGNSFTFNSTSFSQGSINSYFQFGTGFVGYSLSNTGSTFTITAIPEPSTYVAAIALLALMLWPLRHRMRGKVS
jgi:fibronectin-binding autotransporter adhesin